MKRINPHLLNQGVISPQGIKRIIRGVEITNRDGFKKTQNQRVKKVKTITNPNHYILVCVKPTENKLTNIDKESIYIANAIAALNKKLENCAILLCTLGECSDDLSEFGIDLHITIPNNIAEDANYCSQLFNEIKNKYPIKHYLFMDDGADCSDIARRFAIDNTLSFAWQVHSLSECSLNIDTQNQSCFLSNNLTDVILLKDDLAKVELDYTTVVRDEKIAFNVNSSKQIEINKLPAKDIPLEQAPLIMSMGNGVVDSQLFMQLAQKLDATIGGSRVVVDDGKLPREYQIGATGKKVNANIYIAVGISGAIQHLQGIENCQKVIAINVDKSCDMVKRADVALIGDAGQIMDQALKLLEDNNENS